jgi:predicted nucleic acid-binding protein
LSAYFFDSSALVKRYVAEIGSTWVSGLFDPQASAECYAARITLVEVAAVLTRRARGGHPPGPQVGVTVALLDGEFPRMLTPVGISTAIIIRAFSLVQNHALRGYDAVQLAAALQVNSVRFALGASALTLVSADAELNAAAAAEGLAVEDPNAHP